MTPEEFEKRHGELLTKHDVCCQEDSDLWSLVSGLNYYENPPDEDGKFLVHITGIYYEDGKIRGDFESYLDLLDTELTYLKKLCVE